MSVAVTLASRIAKSASRVASEPTMSRCRRCVAALLIVLLSGARAPAEDTDRVHPDAEWSGYRVGDTGLWLGGYASMNVEVPQSDKARLDLADLGILVRYELTPSLAFFNETDLDDTVSFVEHVLSWIDPWNTLVFGGAIALVSITLVGYSRWAER